MRKLPNPDLTKEEVVALKRVRDTAPRKTVRRRAQVILLAHKKYQGKEIMKILDLHSSSITSILQKWVSSRMESVTRKKATGQPPKITKEQIDAMVEWLQDEPQEYGYAQTTWTCKMLGDCLKKTFRVELSDERVRQILHERKMTWKKPELQPPTATLEAKKKRAKNS